MTNPASILLMRVMDPRAMLKPSPSSPPFWSVYILLSQGLPAAILRYCGQDSKDVALSPCTTEKALGSAKLTSCCCTAEKGPRDLPGPSRPCTGLYFWLIIITINGDWRILFFALTGGPLACRGCLHL